MFEQSILIDHAGARKTGAFALSLTAQILLAGVLLVAPLIYHDALPIVRISANLRMPVARIAPESHSAEASSSRQSESAVRNVFRVRLPGPRAAAEAPTVIDDDAPVVLSAAGSVDIFPAGMAAPVVLEGPPQQPAPKPVAIVQPEAPVPVSGGVQAAKLIKQVIPSYPALAVRMRASGVVHLLGIIGKDGRIQNLRVLSGHPLLTQAALDAVREWVYSPTVLSGKAVEVEAPIDVIFTLAR